MIRLFISDLHLSKERPAVTRAFFRFMEQQAALADELYILGDLFEAWIGDDNPETLARAVVAGLRKLSDSGTRVYFLHGNRDFLVGRRFARETGCTLLPDYHCITSGDQTLLLCHGDTLCTGDRDYQRYRRRVRNPLVRWLLARLPLKKRLRIAADWRAKSHAANSNKPDNIMDVTPGEAERVLAAHQAAVLIHGHTHRPAVHHHDNGSRVVLGDWGDLGWYVKIEGEHLDLIDFPVGTKPPNITEDDDQPPATPGATVVGSLELEPLKDDAETDDKGKENEQSIATAAPTLETQDLAPQPDASASAHDLAGPARSRPRITPSAMSEAEPARSAKAAEPIEKSSERQLSLDL